MRTARLTVLLPPERKAQIEQKAATMGISTGELVRRAVDDYEQMTPEQEAELAVLVEEANRAIPAIASSLDSMIATVRDTREHIRQTLASLSTRV
jgi:Arc/MetJ-type ribon-helix-helix transcriptional regulator